MIASSTRRVTENTPEQINERIRRRTEMNIAFYAAHPEEVDRRLEELRNEWDIERLLETNAAALTLAGAALGLLRGRRWFALPAMVGGFLLQHAIQGWCPPTGVLRRLGARTRHEIDTEYFALKALRGDFREVNDDPQGAGAAGGALEAARRP